MLTVSVKWQKELFPAVELDIEKPPFVFKCQLYGLTGVPPERQKIFVKGGVLKDDGDWNKLGIKEGQQLMMMGTAGEISLSQEPGQQFMEDVTNEQLHASKLVHTAGLVNLGNTCYLNSTMQCLHSVLELKTALQRYSSSGTGSMDTVSHNLVLATRDLFSEMDANSSPVAPTRFLTVLRKRFPQFGQQGATGLYMQQDAEECWSQMIYILSTQLHSVVEVSRNSVRGIEDMFGITLTSVMKCVDSGEENFDTETVYALKCHISLEVNHLHEGLKQGFKSELQKWSPVLGHSALFYKQALISRLPLYLTVQFVRFFWKREVGKAKILRKVDYPLVLDALDFCSEDLREKLKIPRKVMAEYGLNAPFPSDINNINGEPWITGIYDLVAVLTHKGRSADSGHYVAWVKQDNGKWIQFDDDQSLLQEEEDITRLTGGGDWHMAYICLYKARVVRF